ncbi:MAG TPA: 2Fe-2S iron-sulfur cluster-binding protein [Burkholderiaceae bacterium]
MSSENAPAILQPQRFVIRVEPAGFVFEAGTTDTLLHAAEHAGIELPSSCRNGTCRTCICRLLAGTVHYLIPWPGLSTEEKHEGMVLPCVAHPVGNVVLEQPFATATTPAIVTPPPESGSRG